jgi:hypothetical protein
MSARYSALRALGAVLAAASLLCGAALWHAAPRLAEGWLGSGLVVVALAWLGTGTLLALASATLGITPGGGVRRE